MATVADGVTAMTGPDGGGAAAPARECRVVIVDDDALVRTLLRTILRASGIEVVGEAADGDLAVEAVRAHHPDVVLMDVRMQRVSGIEATRRIRELGPDAPGVIALTSFDSPPAILDAVAAGVAGFLAKDAAPEEIVAAVRQVAAGEGALSPRAARVVLGSARGEERSGGRRLAQDRLTDVTERERDVLIGLAEGLTNAEIAARLFVSEGTVKTHVQAALAKTGSTNRVQLAVLAVQAGWLPSP